ncbi:hypothetical protein [Hyphobacterium sp.]|uniref:hypothetical protein n=1 Tax=Hyphobacterium sp. TaxID=2004662 RepID=UPI003BA89F46
MFRTVVIFLVTLGLSACVSVPNGSQAAPGTAVDFNYALSQSSDEQLLLNMVRLRYRDTTQFLQITSVAEVQEFATGASAETAFSPMGNFLNDFGVGGSASYSRSPVISMSPMDDAQFATAMLTPLSTSDLYLLARSGWSIERILLCCVERFGDLTNSPRASGPTPDIVPDNSAFRHFTEELRAYQRDENLTLLHTGEDASLLFFGQARDDLPAIASRFGAAFDGNRLPLRLLAETDREGIQLQTRSILGTLYLLSHNIDVPASHNAAGLTTNAQPVSSETPDWNTFLDGIFRVHSGPDRPDQAFVAVEHRGYWFWIDDADLSSKTTFNLVSYLIRLKSVTGSNVPVLTLGVD